MVILYCLLWIFACFYGLIGLFFSLEFGDNASTTHGLTGGLLVGVLAFVGWPFLVLCYLIQKDREV